MRRSGARAVERVVPTSDHIVQFYTRDDYLIKQLSEFLGQGLQAGEACVMVATEAHREQLEQRLAGEGLDLPTAREQGTVLDLDAHATLAQCLAEGGLDRERFVRVIGAAIAQAAQGPQGQRRHVRVFGEMVALLWAEGDQAAAIRLEDLWNNLRASMPPLSFSLLCAYPLRVVAGTANGAAFATVCAQHARILPDESYSGLADPNERLRAIALLQQRAASLEVEITERKAAEERLRISENRYRRLFEASTDGILMVDPDSGAVTEANPAMTELLNSPLEKLLGRELRHIGLFPNQQAARRFMQDVREQTVVRYEALALRDRNGGEHYVELVGSQFRTNGHYLIQCHLRDITRRKQAEAAAAHLAAIVTSAEDAIASKTLDGIVTSWNASAERMFGYTADEMIGQPITRLFPPDRLDEEDLILARIRAGLGVEHFETTRVSKDGRLLDVSLTISPVRDSKGTIVGASKIVRDITERKRIEAAVRETEEKVRVLADNIPTLAWMARPDGYIFWYNRRWYEYTGTFPETQEGWGWQSVHDPDELPRVTERWQQSLASGDPFEMIFPLRGADGVYHPFLTRVIPLRDEEGHIAAWFGTNTDVSDLRAAEEALRAANERMDAFLHTATHELKTPLTSLQANFQLAERRLQRLLTPMPGSQSVISREALEPVAQYVARNQRQVRRLIRLVNDLVDAARVQAGRLEIHSVTCDLTEIVGEAVTEQRAVWPERTITFQHAGGLASPVLVEADADRIGQVVTNYLTNALKYSPKGCPVAVTLSFERNALRVARVEVRDQGPGIPVEEWTRVWERGHQVPDIAPTSDGVGLGLGLHISRELVERHGGAVGVASAQGEGSTFWFTLPLARVELADEHGSR